MSDLAKSLEQVLVQYERAMHELGWTMVNVRAKDTLRTLVSQAEEATRVAEELHEKMTGREVDPTGLGHDNFRLRARARAAEQLADRLGNELAQERSQPGGSFDQWDRLQKAEDALRRCKMRAIDAYNECGQKAPQDFFLQDIERIVDAAFGEKP